MVDEEAKVKELLIHAQAQFRAYALLKKEIEALGWNTSWVGPYSGSGSTLEATKTINRRVITT